MDKFIEYAPIIVVIIAFLAQYKIFVTPQKLNETLDTLKIEIENKYVKKETNDLIIENLQKGINEIKEKINQIYNHIFQLPHH